MIISAYGKEFRVTHRARRALETFLVTICKEMERQCPEDAENWAWGRAYIGDDLEIDFEWGDKESTPDGATIAVVPADGGQASE